MFRRKQAQHSTTVIDGFHTGGSSSPRKGKRASSRCYITFGMTYKDENVCEHGVWKLDIPLQ